MLNARSLLLVAAGFLVAAPVSVAQAQFQLDGRLVGAWVMPSNGNRLVFRNDGSFDVFFQTQQARTYNGTGSVARCTDAGGPFCLETSALKCSFQPLFSEGKLTLSVQTGKNRVACDALNGEFRRQE